MPLLPWAPAKARRWALSPHFWGSNLGDEDAASFGPAF
jgi:hypothetical protein